MHWMSYSEGTWTVTAKFDHWQQNTFTSQFEVKKYGRWRKVVLLNAHNVSICTFLEGCT